MLRIKELREELNLKQKDLAEKIGVVAHNVGDWERGKCEPSVEMLSRIADALGVTVDYLIGRTDDFGNVVVKESQILSKNEEKLVNSFRNLSESEQEKLFSDAEFYSKRNK